MTGRENHQQTSDEDLAADMRDQRIPWSKVAQELGVTTATAKLYAAASDRRAADRMERSQIPLFEV